MKSDLSSNSLPAESKPVRLPKAWPHVIRNGDVAVKIYKNKGSVRGENFRTFLLSYYANGKRQLRRFMDFSKASEEATRIAEQKAEGALGAAALSAKDRVSLEQALALLAKNEGIGSASVARLVEIVRDYATARAGLPCRCHACGNRAVLQTEASVQYAAQDRGRGCRGIHRRPAERELLGGACSRP